MINTFKTSFNFVWLWSLLVSIGAFVGFALGQFLARKFGYHDYAIAMFLFIFISGLFIGLGQWIAIKGGIRKVWGWIPATSIGYSVGCLVFFGLFSSSVELYLRPQEKYLEFYQWIEHITILMLIGMFTGALQWFALGRKLITSLKWVLISGLSLVIGCLPLFFPLDWHKTIRISASIIGVIGFALLTGIFAEVVIVRPETNND